LPVRVVRQLADLVHQVVDRWRDAADYAHYYGEVYRVFEYSLLEKRAYATYVAGVEALKFGLHTRLVHRLDHLLYLVERVLEDHVEGVVLLVVRPLCVVHRTHVESADVGLYLLYVVDARLKGFVERACREVYEDVGMVAYLIVYLLVRLGVERRTTVLGACVYVRDGGSCLTRLLRLLRNLLGRVRHRRAPALECHRTRHRDGDYRLVGVVSTYGALGLDTHVGAYV